jgi:broad specificity phosphatase PhoE
MAARMIRAIGAASRIARLSIIVALAIVLQSAEGRVAAQDDPVWMGLRQGGHAVLIRHSITDAGDGEPPGFRFGACETERQLNAEGRAKAMRMAQTFAARGVRFSQVLSSAWCRCQETARLALGRVEVWPALNVLHPRFNPRMDATRQNEEVVARIAALLPGENVFMATHWLNINALSGHRPAEGDGVVVRYDRNTKRLVVVGVLRFY